MNAFPVSKAPSQYYTKVKNEILLFSNINCIFEKTEADGYLSLLSDSIREVFNKEILFAIHGELNRIKENERENPKH